MSIMQKLKEDQIHVRKMVNELAENKIVVRLLTTLIGEAAMIGKNDGNRETTDEEVLVVMKKFLKNINETLDARPDPTSDLYIEIRLLEEYISTYGPKMMTDIELKAVVYNIIMNMESPTVKDMGIVMKTIKENHSGTYDGKLASKLVKEALK